VTGSPDQLRVRLLGGLDIEGLDERAIGSRKARTLVKVLALGRGAPVLADVVVDALWPGGDVPAKPLEQIGVLVSRLRAVIGSERLVRTDAGWALSLDWLDVAELEDRVEEAATRLATGSPTAARAAARAALALVRGDFLADEADPVWAEADRAAVARTIARARVVAADAALAIGDPGDAAAVAEGALDHDPYDEAALRTLMRAHAAAGRPASALAAYARARERLSEDLGVDPVKETETLHTAILLGDVAATLVPSPRGDARVATIVGRSAELAALDSSLSAVERGGAAAVVIEGEAGIGKTALIQSWIVDASPRALVLVGHCDELGRGLPLQPVLDGLADHLRRLSSDETAAVLGESGASLVPLLGPLAGERPVGVQPTTVTDPVAGQAVLFADLLASVERAGGDRPVVIVVEDLHLAAPSTGEWLRYAVHRGRRLLVVASRRPEARMELEGANLIGLGPLDLDAVTALVGAERASDLHERSGGHPLFLVELAASDGDELPASVREAVAARVDDLGDAASTLRAAAVLGSEVDVDLLAGVLDASVATLLEHLDVGISARLIEERGGTLAFRHNLVREALEAGTTAARRAFVHREAARVLRDRARHDPLQVAWHAQRGGDLEAATTSLIDAAALAFERYDVALAEELLDQANALAESVPALLARARVRIARWDITGAHADAARALELGSGAEALEVAAWVEYYRRDYDMAYRYAEEAVERSDHPGLRASCLTMAGRVLHADGDLRAAEPRMIEAVETAPAAVRGFAQVWLAGLRMHQGRPIEAGDLVDRAFAQRRWLGHPFVVHHGHMFRTLALGQRGRVVEALHASDEARAAAIASGELGLRFVSVVDNVRSWILRGIGRLAEADDLSTAVLEVTSADATMATNEMRHASMLDLLDGRLLMGDIDGAAAAVARAAPVETLHGTMAWHHRHRYWVQHARLALATGDFAAARNHARQGIDDAAQRGAARYVLLGKVVAARVAAASGEPFDHDDIDATLSALEACGALEAWLVTAEVAAATGVDRWWRDAERRAGALVSVSGEHAEPLRRWIGERFAGLGR
jgi:DNA-binding SARP family transcriptional activator